jgi:hypothetical protein
MHANLKSALIGGAVAVAFTSATSALAGTGVGGVFNLGKTNTVNAASVLSGATNGAQLAVTNTSTGASAGGVRITVPAGKAPLAVSNTVKATNLDADLVDGLSANQLGRVGYAETKNSGWVEGGRSTLQSVTVNAPQAGFVTISGGATAGYASGCGYCAAHVRFQVDGTDTSVAGTVIDSTAHDEYAPLSHIVTVPVTKGSHTFALIGSWFDSTSSGTTPTWYDPSLTAQFIPFNGAGTTTAEATPSAHATPPANSGVMRGR